MRLPTADVAANGYAESLEDNPAGIGFNEGFDLTYAYTSAGTDAPHEGHALFTALRLGPYHTGLGFQFLEQPGGQANEPLKVTWGHALRLSERLSIGFSWNTFVADGDPLLDDLDTFDAGLQWRAFQWLAAGLAVTDFTTPKVAGLPLDRGYELGLAVRPGTDALTLSGRVRLEDGGDPDPVYGARVRLGLPGPFALVGRWDTADVGDARAHTLLVGLTDQLTDRLLAGAFGYVPDAAADDVRAGLGILARAGSAREPDAPLLTPPWIVEVPIAGDLGEYGSGGLFASRPATPFLNLLRDLRALGRHEDVAAVVLSFGDPELGWARANELREEVKALRAAGKRVYAYITVADTLAYSIAAAADKVFLAPSGGLLTTGLRSEPMYFQELLERIGVRPQFVAIGDFKSAPETFTRREPSEPARAQTEAVLDALFGRVLKHVADGRKVTVEQARALIDKAPYTAQQAKEANLADAVIHYDELERIAREDLGPRFRFAEARDVLATRQRRWGSASEVAVLYAVGTITDGDSVVNPFTGTVTVGGDTFVRTARALREDPGVRAVVLRIDSGGGSVTASDAMWRELKLLAEEKPLIVSMGDIAASGGYYIAAPGAEILASPETITGSIGIFTGKFDLSGLFWLLGVNRAVFQRGEHADLLSAATAWDDEDLAIVRGGMEALYRLFLERVAEGRPGLEVEQVDAVGRGRVFTGEQARACGLVDRPAGLLTAIDLAAARAELGADDFDVGVYPRTSGFGGAPRAPVHALEGITERLAKLRGEAAPPGSPLALVPELLRPLLDHPLLHFRSGQALALLPFTL